jgi:hypothetical protein
MEGLLVSEIRDVKPSLGLWRKLPLREVTAKNNEERRRQSQSEKDQIDDISDPSKQREVTIDEYA